MAIFCVRMAEEITICRSSNAKKGLAVELYEDVTRRLLREIEHSEENMIYLEKQLVNRYYELRME